MGAKLPSVETVFGEAMEIATLAERSAYLDRACGGDAVLRRQVESLLDAHNRAGDFLESPASTPTITLATKPAVDGPGTTIGPYRLLEEIGEGGMGVVYMAEQTAPVRRRVALKVIRPGMDSRQVVARFEAERQALALMDHPNIAKVHDAGAAESGRPYFVMELVRGLPITDYCDREGLSVAERLELFVLVCRAVQHAHQKGVIHRDLKPSNVLVTVVDGVPTPKVIDFGVAKATGGSLTDRSLFTGFHQMIGTPLYMSPEQADLSSADVDTRSDIYALGVLLYELLTGSTPFDRETFQKAAFDEMRRIIREDEPPTPSTRLSSLGESLSTVSAKRGSDARRLHRVVRRELDWIAMKALEKDRRRRYETANDFAADVMNYLTGRAVEACPPTARYRLEKYARRHRVVLSTGALVALALVVGTAVSTWQAVRAVRAESRTAAALQGARQAVDEMYTQVAEKWLSEQASLTTLQREFLEKALGFYERFAAAGGADPEARHEAIRALYRVGVIRQSLGRHAEAETAFRRVVALGDDLRRQHPDRREWHLVLAEGRIRLAALYRQTGRASDAMKGTRIDLGGGGGASTEFASKSRAVRTSEADREIQSAGRELADLRASLLTDATLRRRLAEAHASLGDELAQSRQLPEAEAAIRAAFQFWESLVKDSPAEFEYRYGLARTYAQQGTQRSQWLAQGTTWVAQDEKAEAELLKAEALLSDLRKERPGDVRLRRTLVTSLTNLGAILARADRYAELETVERRTLALAEGLVADFPDVPEYQRYLADALNNLGGVTEHDGRDAETEALIRRSLALREGLASGHPDVLEYQLRLGQSLRSLSSNLRRQGKLPEARQVYERDLVRARAFLKGHPELRGATADFGNALLSGLPIAIELGDHATAAGIAEEWSRSTLSPFTPDQLGEPVVALCQSQLEPPTAVKENVGASPGQLEVIGRANSLLVRELIHEALRRGLAEPVALSRLADALTSAPEGSRDPDLALRLARRAVELKPSDGLCQQSLGWALYRKGDWKGCLDALEKQDSYPRDGDFIAAMAHWQLGDQARARALFGRADGWLEGYEKRSNEQAKTGIVTFPSPSMLKGFRAEAEALMGGPPAGADGQGTGKVG